MLSQTIDFTISLTCLLPINLSYLGLYSNMHSNFLLNNIDSTVKSHIRKHYLIAASLSYTIKLSKKWHIEK